MNNIFDYAEVVIHTCTGDTNVLKFDDGGFVNSKREAEQVATILRMIARSGQDMSKVRNGRDPGDWFKFFPHWAHISFVCVAGRNHLSGDTLPYQTHSFECAHTTVNQEIHA
jgi:hypothetical protein